MCNSSIHSRNLSNLMEPLSFSTFQFLRTRNRLIIPNGATDVMDSPTLEQFPSELENTANCLIPTETLVTNKSQNFLKPSIEIETLPKVHLNDNELRLANLNVLPLPAGPSTTLLNHQAATLPAFEYLAPAVRNISPVDLPLMELNRVGGIFPSFLHRRPRGEKRPIPEEQKDNKYYERRKRNNEAAKKSRDARKIREDRIAFRAAFLEQENSLLRAQVMALRDELQTMRQIIGRSNLNQI
ncbi:uncharacterized protein ACRADG_009819 isoform 2-T2 [Cochliomyia hominivorax]